MSKVTVESLAVQIDRLYQIKDTQGQLSLDAEYRLEAYKMLLASMGGEPVKESFRIADALESLSWPNTSPGHKAVIRAAIAVIRAHHAPIVS